MSGPQPGDQVKVVLRGLHRSGWVDVLAAHEDGTLTVETPDGPAHVDKREVAGWRPA